MTPPVATPGLRNREDDLIARTPAEAKSWARPETVRTTTPIYTHNPARFVQPEAVAAEPVEEDAEPTLRPPPAWMLMLAGAAVAALMGGLLGSFLNI